MLKVLPLVGNTPLKMNGENPLFLKHINMAVNYIENEHMEKALYCSTTMQAFGPIFYEDDDVDEFLEWLPMDARKYDDGELNNKYYEWKKQRDDE